MVQVFCADRVGRIVLDEPEEKNKLSTERIARLQTIVGDLTHRDLVALSVESSSAEIFAAGADIEELAALTPETAAPFSAAGQALMDGFERFPAPVFCLVSGPCFGGALDLALACDHIFATQNALFCHPGVRLGIMTGWGGSLRLAERVGDAVARFMLLSGQKLDARQALEVGLVDQVCAEYSGLQSAFQCAVSELDRWPKRNR